MMIEYRYEPPEIKHYWPLFLSTGWNEYFKMNVDEAEQALSRSTFIVAAYVDGELVGVARAMSDRVMYAVIYDVIVHPQYRRQGIGSTLVEKITRQCKEAGVYSVHLFAAPGTQPFYRNLGYRVLPSDMSGMRYEPQNP